MRTPCPLRGQTIVRSEARSPFVLAISRWSKSYGVRRSCHCFRAGSVVVPRRPAAPRRTTEGPSGTQEWAGRLSLEWRVSRLLHEGTALPDGTTGHDFHPFSILACDETLERRSERRALDAPLDGFLTGSSRTAIPPAGEQV